MNKLLLVRHGESVADIEKKHEGRADFPLTTRGEKQATLLADYLAKHYNITEIYCSTLIRARSTAQKIADKTGLELNLREELMEMNNGHLAGLIHEEAMRLYPMPDGGRRIYDPIPGGESVIDFRMRVESFWHKFYDEKITGDKTICIVAHGGTISMLHKAILELPIYTNIAIPTGDTGFHEWGFDGTKRFILRMNCQRHLEDELIWGDN